MLALQWHRSYWRDPLARGVRTHHGQREAKVTAAVAALGASLILSYGNPTQTGKNWILTVTLAYFLGKISPCWRKYRDLFLRCLSCGNRWDFPEKGKNDWSKNKRGNTSATFQYVIENLKYLATCQTNTNKTEVEQEIQWGLFLFCNFFFVFS